MTDSLQINYSPLQNLSLILIFIISQVLGLLMISENYQIKQILNLSYLKYRICKGDFKGLNYFFNGAK